MSPSLVLLLGLASFAVRARFRLKRASAIAALLGLSVGCGDATEQGGIDNAREWAEGYVVRLMDGRVQGDAQAGSVRFLKIPYAKPPTGALRWKAPEKNEAWSGVRHERAFASACPQAASSQGPASNVEDCLYLNVWAPEPKPEKAPVMVWIHGGGNFAGSAGDKVPDPLANADSLPLFYDGGAFASRHGVVVVTFNYRLGPFGFFSHPGLASEGSAPANQGLLDQRQVLLWVRDNIAAFGGDAENVTIFGESAGSSDVCYHVASPQSRGLFQRAISESGGCAASPRGTPDSTLAATAEPMQAFAKAMGCDDDTALACLRGKSVDEIMGQAMQPDPSSGFFDEASWSFSVVIDGPDGFVPEPAGVLFDRGDIAHVPYLLGSNNDEGAIFTLTTSVPTDAAYRDLLERAFGDQADAVYAVYPPSQYNGDFKAAYSRVLGDSGLVCGTRDVGQRASRAGLPVYMYNFNVPWTVGFGALGAAHASEIGHVFGSPYMPDADSQKVSDAMNAYWAQFARTGDPNFMGAPAAWPRVEPGTDVRLQLDSGFEVLSDFRKPECEFWQTLQMAR